ncbi:hypothetical protein GCM10010103_18010 [Streptomyces paradoxus]|uniref:DUF397 domain-containing protein n=1 Tax=Streptomyces paradoxus TaxID=66375 RepID=A0A7W9WG99_9ACTN|nr:hypothetical protein [Streptomyces paradoxus]
MISPESDASSRLVWFRSSYSNGAGGECLECALTSHGALVRDSKRVEANVVAVSGDAWRFFIQPMKCVSVKP